MFCRPSAAARPFAARQVAARVAPWLVALALLLRVFLPALHHHHDHPHHHDDAVVETCSCGHVHERAPEPAPGDGQLTDALVEAPHFCLACEVELGTPGACAELPPPLPAPHTAAALPGARYVRIDEIAGDLRPPTRAPPARSC